MVAMPRRQTHRLCVLHYLLAWATLRQLSAVNFARKFGSRDGLKVPPPHPSAAPRGQRPSDLALQNAAAAIQAGLPREAERLAAEVLKGNAGNLPAMQLLGTALLMQGRGKDAILPLERAARRSRDAATETRLAIGLRQAGREEEAREQLERAIKRKPAFPPAFLEFANLLFVLGRKDEAIDILRQGLVVAPNSVDLSMQLGDFMRRRERTRKRGPPSPARSRSCPDTGTRSSRSPARSRRNAILRRPQKPIADCLPQRQKTPPPKSG